MRPDSRGFSLFEIIVVLFIFSLMVALAVPSFSRFGEDEARADAKRLASIIRSLSDSAAARKETYRMKVDFATKQIFYSLPEGERTGKTGCLVSMDLQSKGLITQGEVTVFFHPTGGGEAFSMNLRKDDSAFQVSFNPLSGRVRISGEKS